MPLLDAMGEPIRPESPRSLSVEEMLRLRRLDLLVLPRECSTRDYEFGCSCSACLNRAALAESQGYDHSGQLRPPPEPSQPWQVKNPRQSRRAA